VPIIIGRALEEQAAREGFAIVSESMRALIRAVQQSEQSRQEIRGELLEAVRSGPASPMTKEDRDAIRREVHKRHAERQGRTNGREVTNGR
jgi:hypothetical protein